MENHQTTLLLKDFKHIIKENIRYRDTDRQGHVNHSVFATYLESARTELLYVTLGYDMDQVSFVIANLNISFIHEIKWPGDVYVGSSIEKIGHSSFTLYQAIFKDELIVSTATSVIVQVDITSKKSKPMSLEMKKSLEPYLK